VPDITWSRDKYVLRAHHLNTALNNCQSTTLVMAARQSPRSTPSLQTSKEGLSVSGKTDYGAHHAKEGLSVARHSKYIGVTWHRKDKKFQVAIKIKGKSIHLGHFLDEVEAAMKYDEHAAALGRRLNFDRAEMIGHPAPPHDFGSMMAARASATETFESDSNPYAKSYPYPRLSSSAAGTDRQTKANAKLRVLSEAAFAAATATSRFPSAAAERNGPGPSRPLHAIGALGASFDGASSGRTSGMKTKALVHDLEAGGADTLPPRFLHMNPEDEVMAEQLATSPSYFLACFEEPFVHDLRALEDDSSMSDPDGNDNRITSKDDVA
jgi:hypothetical protein